VAGVDLREADPLLLAADRAPNRRALEWLGLPEAGPEELAARLGAGGPALVYGQDPAAADVALAEALGGAGGLVYLGTHLNATARLAAVVLPLSTWAEKDGLFVNHQGRVQRFQRAVARPEDAREDWRVLTDLLAAAGAGEQPASLAALRRQVATELGLPGEIDLNGLPAAGLVPELGAGAPAGGES
jgi:NADH dehydrogenase/NADH:ubiquinone oxidoreductase subunit G